MPKPPSPKRVRLTITVTEDTHEAFQHYAQAAGVSIGRAMGDWLGEQVNAVTFAALRFEEVREEVSATPRAIADRATQAARGGPAERGGVARPAASDPPRPVIRGGKSPGRGSE